MISVKTLSSRDHISVTNPPKLSGSKEFLKVENDEIKENTRALRSFLPGICLAFHIFGISLGRRKPGRAARVVIAFFRIIATGFILSNLFFTCFILLYNWINGKTIVFDNFVGIASLLGNISTGMTYIFAYRDREIVAKLMEEVLEFARKHHVVQNGISAEIRIQKLMRKCDGLGIGIYIVATFAIAAQFYMFLIQSLSTIQVCQVMSEYLFYNQTYCDEIGHDFMFSSVTEIISKSFESIVIILFVCLSVSLTFAFDQICLSCREIPPGKPKMAFALKKHAEFCEIVTRANGIFSLVLTTWCGSSLAGTCLWIRAMKSRLFDGVSYLTFVLESVLTCIAIFLAISWSALRVNEKVDAYTQLIDCGQDKGDISPSMMLHYIYITEDMAATAAETRFTGMGFFTFSRSFILTACASVLTYSLVFYAIQ